MIDNDSKGSTKNQASHVQPEILVTPSLPTPRTFEGKKYYNTEDVAKIIKVTRKTVWKWHSQGLFFADIKTHDGYLLYEVERVMQLKSVYHPKWMRGGYEPSPTTTDIAPEPTKSAPNPASVVRDKPKTVKKVRLEPPIKRNVQIYPSKVIFFPNDRFAKKISTFTLEMYADMIDDNRSKKLVEIKNHKKFGKIVSPFRIFVDEHSSFSLSEPVEQFDFDVLCVCISEYHIGNRYITPGIIYRGLTGKVNKGSEAEPSKIQLADILHSIDKLMFLKTYINMTDYCEKTNCNDGNSFEILSPLLPANSITETSINGKASTVIQLLDESPLWKVACLKNQVMSFDATLLDVPNQNNSKMNIELKNYVMHRIVEVKAHPQLPYTITFDDLFFKCRLEDSRRDKKLDARNNVIKFLEHLKSKKFIKDFELVKRGISFYSIKFNYSR